MLVQQVRFQIATLNRGRVRATPAAHAARALLRGDSGCCRRTQVALNQLALGPVVLSASFAWNLALTGQASKIRSKIQNDGPPTLVNGELRPSLHSARLLKLLDCICLQADAEGDNAEEIGTD